MLLILPLLDFAGFIRRHVGLLMKLGLWSLRLIKASRLAVVLILSSRCRFVAIALASSSMEFTMSGDTCRS